MKQTLTLPALLIALVGSPALAQTTVKDAWVRGTVAQQQATGAFMQITSTSGGKLLSVSSPAAGVVEIHEMKMAGSTMQMRALPAGLDLPAGKTIDLKPGGYHVMLMDLKDALKPGNAVTLTLVIEASSGQKETLVVKASVKALGGMAEHKH